MHEALSYNELEIVGGFERAFAALFDQDVQTFTGSMLLNLDQLEKQLDKKEFQETGSMDAFRVLKTQFQRFINFRYYFDDDDGRMIRKFFLAYTRTEVRQFRDTLFQHMESLQASIQERVKHKREYDRRMNDRMMLSKEEKVDSSKALDAGLVVTKSNATESKRHVSSSRSEKDTYAEDADINSVNDKQAMAKVQLTAKHNILANEQHHYEKFESIYDTYLLEKVDRNTTPDSTDMSHRGGEIDQNAKNVNKTVENADLKAQIQEKVIVNVALKNELTKLKGNSIDTKFLKPSILGKPVLQPPRNQSVVRQPNAFKSERLNFSKPQFASQIDVNNIFSKPVTPHYLPKVRESMLAKPHQVIAPGSN
ncbi:hypothetical protein Tco_0486897 [Tanacetum coccineum]